MLDKERFPFGKQVQVTEKQRQYEDETWLDQPLTVSASDEVGVLVRNGADEARWIARKGLETWRPPAMESMDPPSEDVITRIITKLDAPPPTAALRYNKGKPELDYLFTYVGGVEAVFPPYFDYYDVVCALGALYRAGGPEDLRQEAHEVIEVLQSSADVAGHSIAHELADTNTRGAQKYEQGNYLLGGNWRQYYRSALSHAIHLKNGEVRDGEGFSHLGNFYFNVLMACHVVSTGIGTDDRIRAPGLAPGHEG